MSPRRIMNPVLPGGLLSPLTTGDELSGQEEVMIGNQQSGAYKNVVPTGDVNGTNKVFTLPASPSPASSLDFYIDGQLLKAGGEDYTLSAGLTITTVDAPLTDSILLASFDVDLDT